MGAVGVEGPEVLEGVDVIEGVERDERSGGTGWVDVWIACYPASGLGFNRAEQAICMGISIHTSLY